MLKRGSVILALLTLAFVLPALGDGPGHGRRPHPLKNRQCVAECRRDELACLKDARAAAAPCFEGCKALVDAAHTACAADPQSDACKSAAAAARACLKPCYETFQPAANECKGDGRECVRACPFIGEPPCLADCRAGYVHCLADARAALIECRRDCDDELAAARAACATDPESAACQTARAQLQACLEPCRALLKHDLDECGDSLRECAQGCGDEGATTE